MITTHRQRLEAMVGPERISTTSVTWLASGLPRTLGREREQLGLLLRRQQLATEQCPHPPCHVGTPQGKEIPMSKIKQGERSPDPAVQKKRILQTTRGTGITRADAITVTATAKRRRRRVSSRRYLKTAHRA